MWCLDKPKLEIQVDSIITDSNIKTKVDQMSDEKEFMFKNSMINSIDHTDPDMNLDEQKGNLMHDFKEKLKLSFGNKNNTPKPETHSSPCMNSSDPSRANQSNSEQKVNRGMGMSKEAQILRNKLNISLLIPHDKMRPQYAYPTPEEEKGEQIAEEFDQSRPMTTRIYDDEDDQQLNIQYKHGMAGHGKGYSNQNKHMSVEAGLECKQPERLQNDSDHIGDEQYSMIIKNVDDLEASVDFPFNSQINTPMNHYQGNDTGEEDILTVIENDCDNEYDNIFKSLKDAQDKVSNQPPKLKFS